MKVDKYVMAQANKKSVLTIIREEGPINRAELARITGLSIATIMKITEEFVSENIITYVGKRESTGGKRPELFEFSTDSYHIIGLDFGRHTVKCILMNMVGEILIAKTIETGETIPAKNLIGRAVQLIDEVIKEGKESADGLLGIGIGMPGLLDSESGEVIFSPDFGWNNVDIVSEFEKHFKIPIIIDNANRAMALGEYWFGAGKSAEYLVYVNLGYGIGAAIIQRGEIQRGFSGSSGELGHITMVKDGPLCDCGNRGCLEALSSGNAIAKRAKEMLKKGSVSDFLSKRKEIDSKVVFDGARDGDLLCEQILNEAIDYIGIAVAGLLNLFDPECIVFGGGILKSQDYFMPILKQSIKKHQMKSAGRKVHLKVGELGETATSVGAATMVLKEFIDEGGHL